MKARPRGPTSSPEETTAPRSPLPGDRAVGTARRQALWGDLEGQEGARRQQRCGRGPSALGVGRSEGRHLLGPHSTAGEQAGLLGAPGSSPTQRSDWARSPAPQLTTPK